MVVLDLGPGRGRGKQEMNTKEGQILNMQTVASIS